MGAFPQQGEMVEATIENTASAVTGRETGVKSARSVKVDRRSLDWRAADVLREQILSGKLVPGQRITETALASQLEVSRGTLRAALRALAHEGLIQQVAYTKWMLPEFSNSDAWELYTLRGTLEGMAARLAAQHRTPETASWRSKAAFERSGRRGRVQASRQGGRRRPRAAQDDRRRSPAISG